MWIEFSLLSELAWIYCKCTASAPRFSLGLDSLSRIWREKHGALWVQMSQLWISGAWINECENVTKIFPKATVKIMLLRHNILINIFESFFPLSSIFKFYSLMLLIWNLFLVLALWLQVDYHGFFCHWEYKYYVQLSSDSKYCNDYTSAAEHSVFRHGNAFLWGT